jgi:hypothetical protein
MPSEALAKRRAVRTRHNAFVVVRDDVTHKKPSRKKLARGLASQANAMARGR